MVQQAKAVPAEGLRARHYSVDLETRSRVEFVEVTEAVQKYVAESGVQSGVCHLYTPHTSAALLIQENDDSSLRKDLDHFLAELAPRDRPYHHNDGNCDAHLKASLIGCSKTLLVDNGKLLLGRWQGVFFCEFDGPRRRELHIKIVSD